uniref:Uncharacterized protein n=1 Tax=Ciona intestinalis TaxID=7719 RepID=H2XVZ4_CIOIN
TKCSPNIGLYGMKVLFANPDSTAALNAAML